MPYIQVNDRRFALRAGETRIGTGPDAEVRFAPAPAAAGAHATPELAIDATVDLSRDSHAAIRRAAPAAAVRVNGVLLGAEPTPLIHGDKIEIRGAELYFGDDRKGGSTQFISASSVPDLQRLRATSPTPAAGTTAKAGRVISLVDGREYSVGLAGLTFGRDAGCDVVIPAGEVSRRHAEIQMGDAGYVVTDTSTNGLFVNGDRVEGSQILRRGDVIRMGTEEFRFYADAMPAPTPATAPAPGAAQPAPPPMAGDQSAAPRPAADRPPMRSSGEVTPQSPPVRAVATLEVLNAGVMRGRRYPVTSVIAHVGRGAHNEVVIAEESVSDSHATLQRRDGAWFVTDLGSTNGTYVNGKRIQAEEMVGQSGELRFGGVKLAFATVLTEPFTAPRGATRMVAGFDPANAIPVAAASAPAPVWSPMAEPPSPDDAPPVPFRGRAPTPPMPPPMPLAPVQRRRMGDWVWILVAAAVGVVGYLMWKGP